MSGQERSDDAPQRRQLSGAAAIGRAIEGGEPVRLILHSRAEASPAVSRLLADAERAGIAIRAVGARELRRLAPRSGSVEVLALLGPNPTVDLELLLSHAGAVWLLAGTAYPGNAGFVIRTAEVSGADGVVIDAPFDRTARRDAYRAAMRADRFLPVLFEPAIETVERARCAGLRVIAIEDVGDRAPWQADLAGRTLFIVGGEERGVPAALLERADDVLRIPMAGFIPSYNLQAAMAAVMAERLRQLASE